MQKRPTLREVAQREVLHSDLSSLQLLPQPLPHRRKDQRKDANVPLLARQRAVSRYVSPLVLYYFYHNF